MKEGLGNTNLNRLGYFEAELYEIWQKLTNRYK